MAGQPSGLMTCFTASFLSYCITRFHCSFCHNGYQISDIAVLLKNSTQQKEGIYMYSMIGFKSFISCQFMIMYFHVSGFFETFSYPLAIFFPVHVKLVLFIFL